MPTNYTVCGRLYIHLSRHMKSHQQLQQPSTCGQCGKIFSRPDNLSKHLKHCTGHKQLPPPPPPPQQQQTAAPPPPKFTIRHQYSSMGGVVERCNINMQETPPLPSVSRPTPPPPTNNDTGPHQTPRIQKPGCHHDFVSQGGGPECCHANTSYPNFGNDCCVCSR